MGKAKVANSYELRKGVDRASTWLERNPYAVPLYKELERKGAYICAGNAQGRTFSAAHIGPLPSDTEKRRTEELAKLLGSTPDSMRVDGGVDAVAVRIGENHIFTCIRLSPLAGELMCYQTAVGLNLMTKEEMSERMKASVAHAGGRLDRRVHVLDI